MRVMLIHQEDLFTIMECHFQRSISQAIKVAVPVQISFKTGEFEYQSSCAYYYSFLFSGWWFNVACSIVALNGRYDATLTGGCGFTWYNQVLGHIYPTRAEMKIRRQQ
jgi:hypothetical protein